MPSLSVIIPLTDVRTCGWGSVESAVSQAAASSGQVEVVAACGRFGGDVPPPPAGLLAPPVVVAACDADASDPDHEIRFYEAGAAKASGDLLFFIEGHTVLLPGAARAVLDWFSEHSDADAAWAPRINQQTTPLGQLVGMNNAQADVLAPGGGGMFTLGGNSIVRRSVFERLGGFDSRLGRVAELDFEARLRRSGVTLREIPTPLCRHDNDMAFEHFACLSQSYARLRRQFLDRQSDLPPGMPHPPLTGLRRILTRRPANRISRPLLELIARRYLAQAVRHVRSSPAHAYRLYLRAMAAFDLAGAC